MGRGEGKMAHKRGEESMILLKFQSQVESFSPLRGRNNGLGRRNLKIEGRRYRGDIPKPPVTDGGGGRGRRYEVRGEIK